MGLPIQAIVVLAGEHRLRALPQPVLMLGRQNTYASAEAIAQALAREGFHPAMPSAEELAEWRVPGFTGVSDRVMFALLGIRDVLALDMSPHEGAAIVHDLNVPVPESLVGRFGTIVDGGTMEHVFDTRTCLRNIAVMLREGGRVIHMPPTNNYMNHGFIQVSPTLLFDYYEQNGFDHLRGLVFVQPRENALAKPWGVIEYPNDDDLHLMAGDDSTMVFYFSATKGKQTAEVIPTQRFYQRVAAGLPMRVRTALVRYTAEGIECKEIP